MVKRLSCVHWSEIFDMCCLFNIKECKRECSDYVKYPSWAKERIEFGGEDETRR